MEDAANLDGVGSGIDEKEPVVADAEPQFFPLSPERLHIARARFREAMEGGENAHSCRLVQTADINGGRSGPDDPLYAGSL